MSLVTYSGFPRIGLKRELKRSLESHWQGETSAQALLDTASMLRRRHWQLAAAAGADVVPCNDFSLYDHVLDTAVLFDAIPARYRPVFAKNPLDGYFAMARGHKRDGHDLHALEMTKWFDTNYHYLVPELAAGQRFALAGDKPLAEFREAQAQGHRARPVLLGPVSFLLLSKSVDGSDRLALLDALLVPYVELLGQLADAGADWVQLDEPCLVLDQDEDDHAAYRHAYAVLAAAHTPRLLLASYFGALGNNLTLASALPVDGLHIDLVRAPEQLDAVLDALPIGHILSVGVVDGRNVWRSRPERVLPLLRKAQARIGSERLWLAPSCSLLHVPIDLEAETALEPQRLATMAFARQKLEELRVYADALAGAAEADAALAAQQALLTAQARAPGVLDPQIRARLQLLGPQAPLRRSAYAIRQLAQSEVLRLPPLPTTTIGSFPQTQELRKARAANRTSHLNNDAYDALMKAEIERVVREGRRDREEGLQGKAADHGCGAGNHGIVERRTEETTRSAGPDARRHSRRIADRAGGNDNGCRGTRCRFINCFSIASLAGRRLSALGAPPALTDITVVNDCRVRLEGGELGRKVVLRRLDAIDVLADLHGGVGDFLRLGIDLFSDLVGISVGQTRRDAFDRFPGHRCTGFAGGDSVVAYGQHAVVVVLQLFPLGSIGGECIAADAQITAGIDRGIGSTGTMQGDGAGVHGNAAIGDAGVARADDVDVIRVVSAAGDQSANDECADQT